MQAPGIGPKIAATLITEYGTLSNLIEKADMIKQKKRRESLVENAEKVRVDIFFLLCTHLLVANHIPNILFNQGDAVPQTRGSGRFDTHR